MFAILKKNNIKIQYIAALVLLWFFGIFICIYLLFNFKNINAPKSFSFTTKLSNAFSGSKTDTALFKNDAYVFINVNKKHFLTRFVASINEKPDLTPEKKKDSTPLPNPTVEKVTKRLKQNTSNKTPDFIIKQAPEI